MQSILIVEYRKMFREYRQGADGLAMGTGLRIACGIIYVLFLVHSQLFLPSIGADLSSIDVTSRGMYQSNSNWTTTPHERISIGSDIDFHNLAAEEEWPGIGLENNPYIIEGFEISDVGPGISIDDTTVYFVIRQCIISSDEEPSGTGIYLYNVTHASVEDTIIDTKARGIYLIFTSNSTIQNVTIRNAEEEALYIRDSASLVLIGNSVSDCNRGGVVVDNSADCTLAGNRAFRCSQDGFVLHRALNATLLNNTSSESVGNGISLLSSSSSSLYNNTADRNSYTGIHLEESDDTILAGNSAFDNSGYGVSLIQSSSCIMISNSVFRNSLDGFFLVESDSCSLTVNEVHGNSEVGIRLFVILNSILYENSIGWNSGGNAYDDGINSVWDDGISKGNRWSDYEEGDTYVIPGTAMSIDRYPAILLDTFSPTIDHPPDIQYDFGAAGQSIYWNTFDYEQDFYEVSVDGTNILTSEWNTRGIRVDVSGLEQGVYTYTLRVHDMSGNTAEDSVVVTVSGPPISMAAITVIIGVIVIIVILAVEIRGREVL
ncbi:MAG: right-handed parallel beta-helix repeat-containing protein [Candidatus Thorarchaeota archaeon]|nr:MAG: right-handed parallel beta-helix repeat-containing protein [Candidatus Thorarchaeota archaeon]